MIKGKGGIMSISTNSDSLTLEKRLQEKRKAHIQAIFRKIFSNLMYVVLYLAIAFVFVTPLLYVLGNSFRTSQAIWTNVFPVSWKSFVPFEGISFVNYIQALGLDVKSKGLGLDLSRALWISLSTSVCVVLLSLVFNTGAAYFFGRLKFPKKKWLLVYVVATMMIPQQVVLVPLYLVVDQLGMINSFWAMVVPWYASPFIIFALTQFFADLPYELDEAAIIDGANLFQILWRIIIPNSLPGLLTVSLLEFQFIWNEFYWPLIAISNQKLYPIQIAIATQFTDRDPQWGRVFAAMVIASLPVILLFLFLQKYFYENAAMSGIKG
jgi:ABC-type glycerol-3-phosphate transport system permease component